MSPTIFRHPYRDAAGISTQCRSRATRRVTRRETIEHRRHYRCCNRLDRWHTKGDVNALGLTADPTLLSIGAVGLALALTTFRSSLISPFLRVFSTIFAVEYVVTALSYVAVRAGWWPSSFSKSTPPASLPHHCGDLRTSRLFDLVHSRHSQITLLADPYFVTNDRGDLQIRCLRAR